MYLNQIAALGYVSRTNHIIAFEYPKPITAFGRCFHVNDVMDQAHLISVMVCGHRESLVD